MKLLRRLRRLVIGPYREIKRPTFLTDDELEARIRVARDLVGDRQIPRLIEPQPDYGERKPVDFERLPV